MQRIRSAAAQGWSCRIKRHETAAINTDAAWWRQRISPAAWARLDRAAQLRRGVRLSPFEVEFSAARLSNTGPGAA